MTYSVKHRLSALLFVTCQSLFAHSVYESSTVIGLAAFPPDKPIHHGISTPVPIKLLFTNHSDVEQRLVAKGTRDRYQVLFVDAAGETLLANLRNNDKPNYGKCPIYVHMGSSATLRLRPGESRSQTIDLQPYLQHLPAPGDYRAIIIRTYRRCEVVVSEPILLKILPAPQETEKQQYSPRALELLEAYSSRVPLNPEHVRPAYRLAWEELLLGLAGRGWEEQRTWRLKRHLFAALRQLNPVESMPVLVTAFKSVPTHGQSRHKRSVEIQHEILMTLLRVCNQESLKTILELLDFADQQFQGQPYLHEVQRRSHRENVFCTMLKPLCRGGTDLLDEVVADADQWQALVRAYPAESESPANQELLQAIREFERLLPAAR